MYRGSSQQTISHVYTAQPATPLVSTIPSHSRLLIDPHIVNNAVLIRRLKYQQSEAHFNKTDLNVNK